MIGHVPSGGEIRRSGAKPGDGIYVTGLLGGSMLGLEQLRSGAKPGAPAQRHLYPSPRHRVGQAVAPRAHAMIDVSDGLSTDLMHVLEESKVSARIYKHLLPVFPGAVDAQALHGGEEYELLITALDLPAEIAGVRVTRIGEITPAELDYQIFLIDGSQEAVLKPEGFQHFAASSDKK